MNHLKHHRCGHLLIALLTAGLFACSGGGKSGDGGNSSSSSSISSTPAPQPTIVTSLTLGAPTSNPALIPPSATAVPVTFLSVVRGNYYPEQLLLDEVDKNGTLLHPGVAILKDDGANGDAFRGDQIYSGQLLLGSVASLEKSYRVHADHKGNEVVSGTGRFWVSGCPSVARPSNPDKAVLDISSNSYVFANEVLVTLADTVAPELSEINAIMAQAKGQVVGCIPALNQYLIELSDSTTAASLYAAIDILKSKTAVVVDAAPNAAVLSPPADKTSCDGKECQWYMERIRAPEAWALVGGGDKQMSVGVIDFGVDCKHSDVNCRGGSNSEDKIDHGTGVASLIAAQKGDGSGVMGIAWNSTIYPYSFMARSGSQYQMSELITMSMTEGSVRVINISAATALDSQHQLRDAMCSAIDSGRLIVAAAGNASTASGCQLQTYPTRYNTTDKCANGADLGKGLLVVGAIDSDNNLAQWENNSLCSNTLNVDVFAPGKNIYTASANNNGYAAKNGTSFASPLAAGSAAVLWAAEPTLTVSQVHDRLVSSSAIYSEGTSRQQTQDPRLKGKPLLDLFAAVGGKDRQLAPDAVPDAFAFTALTNVDPNAYITSAPIVIKGIDISVPISVEGGFYAIDNAPFTSAAGTVGPNQTLVVQLLSAHLPLTSQELTLKVAGISQSFKVTTAAAVAAQPGNFNFTDIGNAEINSTAFSSPLKIAALPAASPISISGGEYAIDGGAFTSANGTLNANQTIQLRVATATAPDTYVVATVTIGGVSDSFRATTVAADINPEPFAFADINNIPPGTLLTSNSISVGGINTAANISISGGEYSINGGAYSSASGKISAGQTVTIRHKSANQFATDSYTALTIGNYTATFRSHTQSDGTNPTNSAPVASNVTISDSNGGATLLGDTLTGNYSYADANSDLEGSSSYIWLRNGIDVISTSRSYTVTQADSGKSLQFKVTPRALNGTVMGAEVSSAVFTVTAFAPAAFTFMPVASAAPGSSTISGAITISGIDSATSISIAGGDYSINDGPFTSAAGTVSNGQTVKLRVAAPTALNSAAKAVLTVGGVSASFSVTTPGGETIPPALAVLFPSQRAMTDRRAILVRGTASDSSGIGTISINGTAATFNSELSSWQATVPLNPGENTLTITAADTQNNTTTRTLTVRSNPLGDGLYKMRIDAKHNRFVAFDRSPSNDSSEAQLITIDRTTGATTAIPNGHISTPVDLQVSADGTRALVMASPKGFDEIKEINLLTGERKFIAQDTVAEPSGTYHQLQDIEFDPIRKRVFLADSEGIIQVELSSGIRRNILPQTSDDLAWDATHNRLIIATYGSILALDPETSTTQVLANNSMAISSSNTSLGEISGIVIDEQKNLAYAVAMHGSDIIEVNLATGSRRLVSDSTATSGQSEFGYDSNPKRLVLDKDNNQLLVAGWGGVVGVDIASGTKKWIMKNLSNIIDIKFFPDTKTIIALTQNVKSTLYSFVLGATTPTIVSNNALATTESNVTFVSPSALAIDPARLDPTKNLVYVCDSHTNSIFAVNLQSGQRTTVSDNTSYSQLNRLMEPKSMLWLENEKRVLVLDRGSRSILAINTDTATRSKFSDTSFPDTANAFKSPVDMLLSPVNGDILVLDNAFPASIVSVNPASGARSIYSSISSNFLTDLSLSSIIFNNKDNSIILSSPFSSISRLNSNLIHEHFFTNDAVSNIYQLLYDGDTNSIIALKSNHFDEDSPYPANIDASFTTSTPLPVAPTNSGEKTSTRFGDLTLDTAANFAYVIDNDSKTIFRVSLSDGKRTLFAGNDIAKESSNINFVGLAGIDIDIANNRLLVGDYNQFALIAVDLKTASRTLIAKDTIASSTSAALGMVKHLTVDASGRFVYCNSWSTIARVDTTTGEIRMLSNNSTAPAISNIEFDSLENIVLDEAGDRLLVADKGAETIIAVDLKTGARTEFIKNTSAVAQYPNIAGLPTSLAINQQSKQVIGIDGWFNDIYLADLATGILRNMDAPTDMFMTRLGVNSVKYNPTNNSLVMVENYRNAIVVVDLTTGESVVLSQ